MKTAGLYIHFPFCVKKCNYCDFLSFPTNSFDCEKTFSSYIGCVKNEITYRKVLLNDTVITSIFFGGGTPSLMLPEMITDLMDFIHQKFILADDVEITMECNPGTLTASKLQALYSSGINRLSLGLQSTNSNELSMLGRIHTYEQFFENYKMARQIGFNNINIDLMSALPGQTIATYKETLQQVLELKPEHISAYSLIVEEGTPFDKALPAPLPSEDDDRQMYHLTKHLLHEHGYKRYELSNYAQPGFDCRHNIGYWIRKDYLGIGLGSASLIEHRRFSNIRNLTDYINLWQAEPECADYTEGLLGAENIESLSQTEEMEEFMFLGLRLNDGISPQTFEQIFGVSLNSVYHDAIAKHITDNTLFFDRNRLKLTETGQDVANYVMADFLF